MFKLQLAYRGVLFGMINWIYTWYKPRVDGNAEALARQMGDIFLGGVASGKRFEGARLQARRKH
jgi:tetracycline repressor-like protein